MHKISVKDFPGLDLGDVRRNERFVTMVERISRQPGSSIPRQAESWYDAKAAYHFFSSKSVSLEALNKIIQSYGVKQATEEAELLVIHDTSNISFGDLQAEGLGYLDNQLGRGILCHSSIAVSANGLPLSLLRQHSWVRPLENLEAKAKTKTRFEDRESYRWHQGITEVNKAVGEGVKRIHIADREADIYELFFLAYEPETELLIRAHYNRRLSAGSSLWEQVGSGNMKGEISLLVPDERGRKKATIKAEVRYEPVEILRPVRSGAAYESVELTAIEVKQIDSDDNNEGIHWKLLTTLEVRAIEDVLKYIKWYSYRWLIERFHYVLKSGTRVEQLQLKKASSLQKAIAIYSLAGFRIMQMVYQSRSHPDASCEVVLTQAQWQVLYVLLHKDSPLPVKPPSLSQAVRWIARLGGHLGRKSDGPPGLKTTWLGYQRVLDAANVYEQLVKQNLGKA